MAYTLEQLLAGFRAMALRAEMRAEKVVVSPRRMTLLLDAFEQEIAKYKEQQKETDR